MSKKITNKKRGSEIKSEKNISFNYTPDKKKLYLIYSGIIILAILLPFLILRSALSINGYLGFPLDDPWIHLTFAKNLAKYFSFSYFKNELVTAGSTSPIYTMLLSIGFFISNNEFILSYFLGIGFFIFAVIYFYKLSSIDFNKENIFALLLTAIFVADKWMNFISISGMETTMFIFILIACTFFYRKRNAVWFAIFTGLIIWTRPDGVAFYAALIVDYIYLLYLSRTNKNLILFSKKDYQRIAVIFFVMLALYFIMNLMLSGSLLPNTYKAKLTYYSPEFRSRWDFLKYEVWDYFTSGAYGIIMVGFIFSVILLFSDILKKNYNHTLLYIGFIVALVFIYWYKLPYAHRFGRYMMPIIPFMILSSGYGFRRVILLLSKSMKSKTVYLYLSVILFGVILIMSILNYKSNSKDYANECKYINDRQVTAALWLKNNTKSEDIVATHDVGAIGFYSERKIVDIAGLITPDLITKINQKDYSQFLSNYLKEKEVTYLAVLREWYRISNINPLFSTFGKLPPETMEIFRYVPDTTYILSNEMKSMLMYIEENAAKGGNYLQQAKQLIIRAEKMEPNAAVIYYISASISAKLGDFKNAESEYLKSLQIFPEYKEALKQLIYLYKRTSRLDEAQKFLDKYLSLFPNDEDEVKLKNAIGSSPEK